nr:MoxR family ATPase [Zavarzinella formosa]
MNFSGSMMMPNSVETINAHAREARDRLAPFFQAVSGVLVGQRRLVEQLLTGLLTNGHVLLEGVPGLAKTLAVQSVAQALHLEFKRIQFTPDLLPADVIGTQIYDPNKGEFKVRHGPVFANIVLADEINRAPAKVQSALLQAMQERAVTIGEQTYPLPEPFFVLATQNPVEQEGTYNLPEAQVDRFMIKAVIGYPSRDEELSILNRMGGISPKLDIPPVITAAELASLRDAVDRVHVDVKIHGYVVDLVRATRHPGEYGLNLDGMIQYGASPRATIALFRAAKAQALLNGRGYVIPQDVKTCAADVMSHRVIVSYEAEARDLTSTMIVRQILDRLPVP